MPEAGETDAFIKEVYQDAVRAVGNGSAAMEDVNGALALLKNAKEKMQGSRTYALQQLEYLNLMLTKARMLLQGSGSLDIMRAVADFEAAVQLIENYANRMAFQVTNLEQIITIVEFARRDQELDPAGLDIRNGLVALEAYRSVL